MLAACSGASPLLAGEDTYTVAQFARLQQGMSQSQVVQILGEPYRTFGFRTEPGSMPVILSRQTIDLSRTSRRFRHRGVRASLAKDEDKLEVLEYESPGWNYFVVLRDDKLFYTVGPVSDDERDPETVRKRYGGPIIHIEEKGGYFLRGGGSLG